MSAQELEQFSFESQLTNSDNDVREKIGQEVWSGGNNPLHRANLNDASARFVADKVLPGLEILGEEQGAAHEAEDDPGKRRRRRRQESDRDKKPDPSAPPVGPRETPEGAKPAVPLEASPTAPPAQPPDTRAAEPGAPEAATAPPPTESRRAVDARHEQLMERLDAILNRVSSTEGSARERGGVREAAETQAAVQTSVLKTRH